MEKPSMAVSHGEGLPAGRRQYGIKEEDVHLLLAADAGDLELVRKLLRDRRADVNAPFSHPKFNGQCRGLHYACRSGHLHVVKALIEEFRANINSRGGEDWTPVYYAVNNGHTDIVEYLVSKGADVTVRDNYHHRSPLEVAKYRQFHDIVHILAEAETRCPTKGARGNAKASVPHRRSKKGAGDAAADGNYNRSAEEIEKEGRKKVYKGVHKQHMDLFLGRYRLPEGTSAIITNFRKFTANADISYDAVDTVLQVNVRIRHSHDREGHTAEVKRMREAGDSVLRSSVLSTNEFMLVTIVP